MFMPWRSCLLLSTLALIHVMSTFDGHSLLHALQAKHESITLSISFSSPPWVITSLITLALALVVMVSSFVALYTGHMAPPMTDDFLQSAAPLHCSMSSISSLHSPQSIHFSASYFCPASYLRHSSIGGVSTILPMFMSPSGSQHLFSWRISSYACSPYISGINSPLNLPSPCSPLRLPLCFFTMRAVSSATCLNSRLPFSVLMSIIGLRCSSPVDICP